MATDASTLRAPQRARRLPPLLMAAVALSVLTLVLPSALRIPQQDPSPVLEYAPVPPSDENPPNQQGNLSSLALGSSSSLAESGKDPPPPPPPGDGKGGAPPTRCVFHPEVGLYLQTEDPNSPQCVPYPPKDNGGATWMGVSGDEIQVVLYQDRGDYGGVGQEERHYGRGINDVDMIPQQPCTPHGSTSPSTCAHIMVRAARALTRYFNTRFQTYGRRVHLWLSVTEGGDAQSRRADAVDIIDQVKPFSVIDDAVFFGNNENFVDAVATRRAMVFSSQVASHTNKFYVNDAPFAWGFWPDVEHWAALYASNLCTKVKGRKVAHSGGQAGLNSMNGRERKYGLWYTTDPAEPGLQKFASLVKDKMKACGMSWAAEATYEHARFAVNSEDDGEDAQEAVGKFKNAGVTTVLYLGGTEGRFSIRANQDQYYPEIILAGDLDNDDFANARLADQTVWKNTWAVTMQLREDRDDLRPGYQAAKEGDPNLDDNAARYAAEMYRDFFQLFTGIQVSGPRLTPKNVDKGFHALKPKRSVNPYIAACFFDPNDYTCVKDAAEAWWDPNGRRPSSNQPGCWRMVRGGKRYLAGEWEGGDDVFGDTDAAPCNGRQGTYRIQG